MTADNADYLLPAFEKVQQDSWDSLSLTERMDALRLIETRTAELEGRPPRVVVCQKMDANSHSDATVVRINGDQIGEAKSREAVLRPFTFKGHSISFRGDFESLMKEANEAIADNRQFVRDHEDVLSIDGCIERGTRKLGEMRQNLSTWVKQQEMRPIEDLRQDLHEAEIRLEKERGHAREMGILQDQNDIREASLKGQTLDQLYAEREGYKQVFPKNFYGSHDGNPNLFEKGDKLYELLPSGNIYQRFDFVGLASSPEGNVRKQRERTTL